MNTLPKFPLTADECWSQRDYILTKAEEFGACKDELNRAKEALDGTELLTILTRNVGWINDRLYTVNELPQPEEIPNLTKLNCNYCTSLTSLPEYPNLTNLDCRDCSGLTSLPEYPNLAELACHGCAGLIILSKYPNLTGLVCDTSINQDFLVKMILITTNNKNKFTLIIKDSDESTHGG